MQHGESQRVIHIVAHIGVEDDRKRGRTVGGNCQR